MRSIMIAMLFLLAGSLAFAQKANDPGLHRARPAKTQSVPKSVSADAVAAALRTSSSSANELSKIEHQNVIAKSTVKTPHSVTTQATNPSSDGKNKPIHFTYKAPQGNAAGGKSGH